ncbi:MAG: hypothetical protein HZC02_01400 [Candidatus Levybacteria bacterium]|nr:hypothetical protein [Candidatus Levybacteria bacterium]
MENLRGLYTQPIEPPVDALPPIDQDTDVYLSQNDGISKNVVLFAYHLIQPAPNKDVLTRKEVYDFLYEVSSAATDPIVQELEADKASGELVDYSRLIITASVGVYGNGKYIKDLVGRVPAVRYVMPDEPVEISP